MPTPKRGTVLDYEATEWLDIAIPHGPGLCLGEIVVFPHGEGVCVVLFTGDGTWEGGNLTARCAFAPLDDLRKKDFKPKFEPMKAFPNGSLFLFAPCFHAFSCPFLAYGESSPRNGL